MPDMLGHAVRLHPSRQLVTQPVEIRVGAEDQEMRATLDLRFVKRRRRQKLLGRLIGHYLYLPGLDVESGGSPSHEFHQFRELLSRDLVSVEELGGVPA